MTATTITFPDTLGAKPKVYLDPQAGGIAKIATRTVEVAATSLDETDDRVMILTLPSGARLIDLILFNDDLDSNGSPALTADIGVYYGGGQRIAGVEKVSGDVIDDDAIATVITTLQTANTLGVRVIAEQLNIANIGKPLFQVAGLTTDPGGNLHIGISVGTAAGTAAAGTVTMTALYI